MKRNNVGTFIVNVLRGEKMYNSLMCIAGIVITIILSCVALGSGWFTGLYDDFFTSIAFMESLLLTIFMWKKIKFKKHVKKFTFVWCTSISFVYATIMLAPFFDICTFEEIGTVLLLVVNFIIL